MAFDAEQAAIEAARTSLTQSYKNRPNYADELREEIYGGEQALGSLRENRDSAIQGLYDADKRMADRYANPESDIFIKDPYAREKLMSAQHQTELGGVQDIMRMIESREDVLGDILTKGLELYDYGLKAEEFEYNAMLKDLENAMKIAEFNRKKAGSGGGSTRGLLDLKKSLQASQAAWAAAEAPQDLVDRQYKNADRFFTSPEGVEFEWDIEGGKWDKKPYQEPQGFAPLLNVNDEILSFLDANDLGLDSASTLFGVDIGATTEEVKKWGTSESATQAGVANKPITPQTELQYKTWLDKQDAEKKTKGFEDFFDDYSGQFDAAPTQSGSATITPTPATTPPPAQDLSSINLDYATPSSSLPGGAQESIRQYLLDPEGFPPDQAARWIATQYGVDYQTVYNAIITGAI